MFNYKEISIISPHVDDSFFSLWYLINNLYIKWFKIKIINVFTKTNFLLNWANNNAEIIRIVEEKQLLQKYKNIEFINLWFTDAIMRWYNKEELFCLKCHLKDKQLISKIVEAIERKINGYETIFLPIWFWNHIDHILISQNIQIWNQIYYYEELPYASRSTNIDFAFFTIKNMQKIIFDFIADSDIIEHLGNIKTYKSQLSQKHYNEIFTYINKKNLWIRKSIS